MLSPQLKISFTGWLSSACFDWLAMKDLFTGWLSSACFDLLALRTQLSSALFSRYF